MGNGRDERSEEPSEEPSESPATWENVVVGEAKEIVGRAFRDDEVVEEGAEQVQIAHEVREEYDDEQRS